jgi:hypothetical protein
MGLEAEICPRVCWPSLLWLPVLLCPSHSRPLNPKTGRLKVVAKRVFEKVVAKRVFEPEKVY